MLAVMMARRYHVSLESGLRGETMNLRDVITTASLLLVGIFVGYFMGRQSQAPVSQRADAAEVADNRDAETENVDGEPKQRGAQKDDNSNLPPGILAPDGNDVPKELRGKIANTAFGLKGAPVLGNPAKAKVSVITYSDFE
jgi:hypothetical protein